MTAFVPTGRSESFLRTTLTIWLGVCPSAGQLLAAVRSAAVPFSFPRMTSQQSGVRPLESHDGSPSGLSSHVICHFPFLSLPS